MPRTRTPFRNPVPSQLPLNAVWVEGLRFEANPEWRSIEPESDIAVQYRTTRLLNEQGDEAMVRLEVRSPAKAEEPGPYTFRVEVVGIFGLPEPDDAGDENALRERLVSLNAVAILYGYARGVLTSATAVGTHGPLNLPTVNFYASEEPAN